MFTPLVTHEDREKPANYQADGAIYKVRSVVLMVLQLVHYFAATQTTSVKKRLI